MQVLMLKGLKVPFRLVALSWPLGQQRLVLAF
jgi:hypothetical protein